MTKAVDNEYGLEDVIMQSESFVYDPLSTPQVPPKIDYLVDELLDVLGDDELPALKARFVEPTIPGKPKSLRQKYRRMH